MQHKQTFIVLHANDPRSGLGDELLYSQFSNHECLRSAFPHADFKFIGVPIAEEMKETVAHIHDLIRTAIAHNGADNVVLGGIGIGSTAAIAALLQWDVSHSSSRIMR